MTWTGPSVSPPRDQLHKLRRPLSAPEKAVLDLFSRSLSADWEIYLKPHLNGLRPDFVLLSPKRGIAIFDVLETEVPDPRSLTLRLRIKRSIWIKKEIYDLYCPRLARRSGFGLITSGLIFARASKEPTLDDLQPLLQDFDVIDRPQNPVSFREDLEQAQISEIFPLFDSFMGKRFSADLAQDLRCWLAEPDYEKIQRDELSLTRRQRELTDTRTESGYRRIKGPAGSGKSVVLAARAAKLASEGKSVLVVTFNITLPHYLRSLAERCSLESANRVTWIHFHGWCKRIAELSLFQDDYNDIWRNQHEGDESVDKTLESSIPQLIEKAYKETVSSALPTYDAILVDEAQDFSPQWWSALRRAGKPKGEMLLVADSTQDVYGKSKAWTNEAMANAGFSGSWVKLEESFRLPAQVIPLVTDFVRRFLTSGSEIDPPQSASSGQLDFWPVHLRWLQVAREDLVSKSIEEISQQIIECDPEILAFPDVTVLVDKNEIGERLVSALEERNVHVSHIFGHDNQESRAFKMKFAMDGAKVRVTTIHSFKGWESRSVILVVGNAGSARALATTYVGLTRIKRHENGGFLTVVCSAPKLSAYGKTWEN